MTAPTIDAVNSVTRTPCGPTNAPANASAAMIQPSSGRSRSGTSGGATTGCRAAAFRADSHSGIRAIAPYGKIRDIGAAIYKYATEREFEVVRDYQGHGIGRSFHQEPGVPHFWFRGSKAGSQIVRPGMCFTIEPMLNLGTWKTVLDKFDGWTVRTLDGKLTAQFEHTILMTDEGPEIMTLTKDGPQEGHQF